MTTALVLSPTVPRDVAEARRDDAYEEGLRDGRNAVAREDFERRLDRVELLLRLFTDGAHRQAVATYLHREAPIPISRHAACAAVDAMSDLEVGEVLCRIGTADL